MQIFDSYKSFFVITYNISNKCTYNVLSNLYINNISKNYCEPLQQIKNNVYFIAEVIDDYRNPPVSVWPYPWSAAADFRWANLNQLSKRTIGRDRQVYLPLYHNLIL